MHLIFCLETVTQFNT